MNIDYQDDNFFNVDYVYRIQTFEKYLENTISSEEHYANYKAGLMPDVFYEHNIPAVLGLFRKEFRDLKSGTERYEQDNNNDFPMLKAFINTERELRKVLDNSQLEDYASKLEWAFDHQKTDGRAGAVSRFFLATPTLDSYLFQVEKIFGKGILD
ncbi:hypothetical protein [Flavobacterium luteolum]|uniref:hypothetical protein n=1 Tax=Flavobacterium luteolum TaxID=3003259 RepID=UPI00248D8E88|nr:hypothetical protein [Flavobacterium luteolum]